MSSQFHQALLNRERALRITSKNQGLSLRWTHENPGEVEGSAAKCVSLVSSFPHTPAERSLLTCLQGAPPSGGLLYFTASGPSPVKVALLLKQLLNRYWHLLLNSLREDGRWCSFFWAQTIPYQVLFSRRNFPLSSTPAPPPLPSNTWLVGFSTSSIPLSYQGL